MAAPPGASPFPPGFLAEDRGPTIIAVNATIQGIACLIVILRIISRFTLVKKVGADDWMIVVATILATVNIVIASQSVKFGTGKHKQAIPKDNLIPSGIYRFITRVIYFLISGATKLSVGLLYLRIFPTLKKHVYILIGFIVAMTIALEVATILQCIPVEAVWTMDPTGKCFDIVAFSYSASALAVVTDIWTLVLPLRTVLSLQIQRNQKIVLVGMFSLGLIACIAGIVRMAFLITLLTSTDQPWDTYGTSITSGIEMALGIITASLPSLKPLADRMFPNLFPTSKNTSGATPNRYELGSTKQSRGFVSIGSRRDHDEADSTKAIKVDYDYNVTSEQQPRY
ncbi:Uncharacterized protein BP5553_07204 [Venustampulla echinocandica]|uniref:Rhodopsin domain-containing protein n=1 Tax=Venustampulla echinocandica TaxID=2656787 RepID=A0A370TIU3_9HELO|nr:Uncharacterized protein BP5553_07204 [Venustampulla echinocandica]RDL35273.1 Uncharacterized protein BP5553_07204 [Venustampulla echinocandica]